MIIIFSYEGQPPSYEKMFIIEIHAKPMIILQLLEKIL